MSETTETGKPGRYNRSFGGLVGSMIVLVLVVLGIVVFRGAFRETPEYEPEKIDYLPLISSIQQSGVDPAYPESLPDGWYVKDARFEPEDQSLDLAIATADGRFAGIHQEDTSLEGLVDTYVGGEATEGDEVEIAGTVAPTWQTFSDPGGDHAFAAELGDQTILVYGSADEEELRALVESLTTATVTP